MTNLKGLFTIYNVALGKGSKRVPIISRIICSLLIFLLTTVSLIAIIKFNFFIWTGVKYTLYSIEKHIAIMWASEKGDWNHLLTGARYELFKAAKSDLIASDKFASMISNLANYGIIAKLFQVIILVACNVAFIGLIIIDYKCLYTFWGSLKKLVYRN
jgi:hypothetical protein